MPINKMTREQLLSEIEKLRIENTELKGSSERRRVLFEYAPDAIYMNTLKGVFVDGNRAAEKLTGYKKEELLGKSFLKLNLLSSVDLAKAFKLLSANLMGKPSGPDEFTLNKKGGGSVSVEIMSYPVKIGEQNLVVGIARDISQQKEVEAMLREKEAFSFALFQYNPIQSIVVDQDGIVVKSNQARRGKNKVPQIGDVMYRDFASKHETDMYAELKDCIRANTKKDFSELKYKDQFLHITMAPFPQGAIITCRDITKQKLLNDQVRASLKEKEVLLNEIHHRVKNNMQIISSLIRLQAGKSSDPGIQEFCEVSQSRIRSMALIHESLYKSKDFAGVNFEYYLKGLTQNLLSAYNAADRDISLKMEVKGIILDINRAIPLGLIINELFSNALKYAFPNGKKGRILLKMKKTSADKISLTLSDNGVGIPPELDISSTDSLGLQIVNDLVSQLKGEIKLVCSAGTAFYIKF